MRSIWQEASRFYRDVFQGREPSIHSLVLFNHHSKTDRWNPSKTPGLLIFLSFHHEPLAEQPDVRRAGRFEYRVTGRISIAPLMLTFRGGFHLLTRLPFSRRAEEPYLRVRFVVFLRVTALFGREGECAGSRCAGVRPVVRFRVKGDADVHTTDFTGRVLPGGGGGVFAISRAGIAVLCR